MPAITLFMRARGKGTKVSMVKMTVPAKEGDHLLLDINNI